MNYTLSRLEPFGVLLRPKSDNMSVNALNIDELRRLFRQEQLVILRGFTTFSNAEEFSVYCERWGEISIWPFGKVLELIEQENPKDHIFDNSYVPMHWDGMYRPQVPEYQIFHCVSAPMSRQGGETTFSNTVLALKNASVKDKTLWQKVTGIYKRKMEFYHSITVSPIITRHPQRDELVIRYNEPPAQDMDHFINPPDLEFIGLDQEELCYFHQSLTKALYSADNFYVHEWQNNDVIIADNFSLLHGRNQFSAKAPRHLQRVHVLSNPPFDNPGLEFYK